MDTFLSTLLTMSVTAALVAGIVMLLRLVLRPLPRWITCALWGVVFLRMICPVGLSLPVSLVPQAITSGAYVQHLLPAEPLGRSLLRQTPLAGGGGRAGGERGL